MGVTLELFVKKGASQGQVLSLDGCRSVTIGRAPGNALVLSDDKVSSNHARLDITTSGVILTDVGSKNGTYAGGDAVVGSRILPPGMEVSVGSTVFELRWREQMTDRIVVPSQRRATAGETVAGDRGRSMRKPEEPYRDVVLAPATHPSQRNLTKSQRNLAVLTEVGDLLSTERDPDRFLSRLMDLVFDVLPADRGVLLLVDESGEAAPTVVRSSPRAAGEEIQVSRTILSKVIGGVSVLTADAGSDARLATGVSIVAQNIRSAICVPIRGRRKTVGAIYVDTIISVGVFGKDDLEMLSTVGVLAGTALESIQLFRENVQQERMATIGKLVAGLGHDIRNMLSALKGGMYLLDSTLKDSREEDVRIAWDIVKHGHESIAGLVQDMVSYSKPREPEWTPTDVNQVVGGALSFAREYAKDKDIQITELLDPTIGPTYLDPAAIERCVLNLLTNAVDAVAHGSGVVSVQTQVDDEHQTIRIVVQDNGEGIAAENRDKVFDLLFSTKGSRGTGFGLAITKKIVEEHLGTVSLESEIARGSTFTIELPLRQNRPVAAAM